MTKNIILFCLQLACTHDPHHTWHGDRGGSSHSCTPKLFLIRSAVSLRGAIEHLWEIAATCSPTFLPDKCEISHQQWRVGVGMKAASTSTSSDRLGLAWKQPAPAAVMGWGWHTSSLPWGVCGGETDTDIIHTTEACVICETIYPSISVTHHHHHHHHHHQHHHHYQIL